MPFTKKSSIDEIRARFDNDVERFSNHETGQTSTMDARLSLDLIVQAAAACNPDARQLLDVGCGAGNYTLHMLSRLPNLAVTLVDLSEAMLARAVERIAATSTNATSTNVACWQGDVREAPFASGQFDLIVAGAVLHHLRDDEDWARMFARLYDLLKPGGSLWISDLVTHSDAAVQAMMWARYGDYLSALKDAAYRDAVFAYIEKEDSPRPLFYQLELLKKSGFRQVEILHKNSCFAAFGAIK